MRTRDPQDYLPLKHREFLMLLVVCQEPSHGYALKKAIANRTGGRLQLGPGTLYRTIRSLEDSALIVESETPEPGSDPRRRTYEPTALGREVLSAEAQRLDALVGEARSERVSS